MLPFLGLCPPLTLTILTLGSSVPAMALGPLISTSWLFGRHWPCQNRAQRPNQPSVPCLPFCACQQSLWSISLGEEGSFPRVENQRGLSTRLLYSGLWNELQRQTDLLQCPTWAPSQTHAKEAGLSGKQQKQDKQLLLLSHTPFSPEAHQRRGPVAIL